MSEPVLSAAPSEIGAPEPEKPFIQPNTNRSGCNPCCCTTLQCGARIVATFDIIFGIGSIILFAVGFTIIFRNVGHFYGEAVTWLMMIILLFATISFLHIYFATFLCMGANESSRSKCCVYFIGQIVMIVAAILLLILLILGIMGYNHPYLDLIYKIAAGIDAIYVLISTYFVVVVHFYMQDLPFNSFRPPVPVPDQESQAGVIRPLSNDLIVSGQSSGGL